MRYGIWRDKIMRHMLMLISFKRCLIRIIQWSEERDGQTSHTPPSKTSWLLNFFFYVKFFSMPLHDAMWTEGYLIWKRCTYLMALWTLDARMAQDQREEKKRCFMKQLSTHLFVKNSDMIKKTCRFFWDVSLTERSLCWHGEMLFTSHNML